VQQYSIGCIVAQVFADLSALHLFGRALSDPTRCRILVCLLDGPHYPTDLARHLNLTKANVSNHLAHLRSSGLVTATAEGRRVRYTLSDPRLAHALADLAELAADIEAAAERPPASAAS
jgi:DNA-binding transcriptional ArsR family regulator